MGEVENKFNEIEKKLIEQEHRTLASLKNVIKFGFSKSNKESEISKKRASWLAILRNLFFGRNSVVIISTISLASFVGLYLAWKANSLINLQNDIMKEQNFLIESERRAVLIFELSSILDAIDKEISEIRSTKLKKFGGLGGLKSYLEEKYNDSDGNFLRDSRDVLNLRKNLDTLSVEYEHWPRVSEINLFYRLSNPLEGRIIALTRTLKPYKHLDLNGDLGKVISPEKGQILLSLLYSNISLIRITQKADFSYSDLTGAKVYNLALGDYRYTPLRNYVYGGLFDNSIFSLAEIKSFFLRSGSYQNCLFYDSNFTNSEIGYTDFYNSEFINSKFEDTNIKNCNLNKAVLDSVYFKSCNLLDQSFFGAKKLKIFFNKCLLPQPNYTSSGDSLIVDASSLQFLEISECYTADSLWAEKIAKLLNSSHHSTLNIQHTYSMSESELEKFGFGKNATIYDTTLNVNTTLYIVNGDIVKK